jgi:hypothetical protein
MDDGREIPPTTSASIFLKRRWPIMGFSSDHEEADGADNLPLAGMWTYWCDGVYGYRLIVWEKGAETYLRNMAEGLAKAMAALVEHHAEYIHCAEPEALEGCWPEEVDPETGGSFEDVLQALKGIPEQAVQEYRETGSHLVRESQWYRTFFGSLNDIFPDPDGVWVNFEGELGPFLTGLLDFEAQGYKTIGQLTDLGAAWLGKLTVLSRLSWTEDTPPEQWRVLHKLLGEWNEDNENLSSLQ